MIVKLDPNGLPAPEPPISPPLSAEEVEALARQSKNRAWRRAVIARTIATIPALVVAATQTDPTQIDAMNLWLNLLQTLALPFTLIPLIHFTSDKRVMGGAYWTNSPFTLLLTCAITTFAVLVAAYCSIQSTPFPTSQAGIALTWFGWSLYVLAIAGFAIGPDRLMRFFKSGWYTRLG